MSKDKTYTADADLRPFEDSLALVTESVSWQLTTELVAVKDALGRVLREEVKARFNVPPFDKSAMDGYAVRAADVKGAGPKSPVTLKVVADLPAGVNSNATLKKGQAARIMTGAPLPKGADAVVMVEYTERDDDAGAARIMVEVAKGKNTGQAGEDVKKGAVVLRPGVALGAAEMGMIASLGKTKVRVSKRPKMAVISTGDEVQTPGKPLAKGQIYDANGYALVGLGQSLGCEVKFMGNVRDQPALLKKKIAAAKDADLVALTGGVSVGDYDFVVDLLLDAGVKEVFYKSRIKPGKPTFCGKKGKRLFFGLPGNPVSAMVCFQLYARPAIELMTGANEVGMRHGSAILDADVKTKPGRRKFLRAITVGDGPEVRVRPYPNQKSGVLSSMIDSDALIVVPGQATRVKAGTVVEVYWT